MPQKSFQIKGRIIHKTVRLACLILINGMAGTGQADKVYQQDEVIVRGDALGMTDLAGASFSMESVLDDLPQVAVSSQGGPGGQQDLSIRGSAFSGAGFSLAGLSFSAAQTEHFNAELPFFPDLFYQPVVLSGFEQTIETEGYLVGSVDLRLRPIEHSAQAAVGVGEYSSYWLRAQAGAPLSDKLNEGQLSLGAFGGIDRFNHVNYPDNDNRNRTLGGQLQWYRPDVQADFIAGSRKKTFGARGYYGVNPAYDAEEELHDNLLLASLRKEGGRQSLSAAAAYRELQDDYKLYLPSSLYHNRHVTRTWSGQVGGQSCHRTDDLTFNWRLSGINEELHSPSLGNHRRSRAAVTLIPGRQWERFTVYAGLRQEVFERQEPATLPQGSVEWNLSERQLIRLSASRSIRQPSYTELNYESPASLGNQGLDNQEADNISLDWNLEAPTLQLQGSVFTCRTRDTIDWVRETPESARWTAENIGTVNTYGTQLIANWKATPDLLLRIGTTLLDKQSSDTFYSSRYAVDYARLLMKIDAAWQMTRWCRITATQSYRQPAENSLRTGRSEQWLAGLRTTISDPRINALFLSLSIENLWNTHYQDFPGQDTATGRRFYAAVEMKF